MMLAICDSGTTVSNYVAIYDIGSYSLVKYYAAHADPIYCLCFSKGGQYIAAGSNRAVVISEIESQQYIQTLPFPEGVVTVTFSNVGDKILGRSLKGTILCYDWLANEMEYETSCGFYFSPFLSFDSKDQHIISQREGDLACWDVASKRVVASAKYGCPAISPEIDLIATTTATTAINENEVIMIHKLPLFELYMSIHPDWPTKCMCFNTLGTLLAAGNTTKVGMWHLESGTLHHVLSLPKGNEPIHCISFLPHSDTVLAISTVSQGSVVIDSETGENLLKAPRGHKLCVSAGGVILL